MRVSGSLPYLVLLKSPNITRRACAEFIYLITCVLRLGCVLGRAQEDEAWQQPGNAAQPDYKRLGAQIEQQWQEFIKVRPWLPWYDDV